MSLGEQPRVIIPLGCFFKSDTELRVRVDGSYSSADGGGRLDVQSERDIPVGYV
jgi:hypothetical protein